MTRKERGHGNVTRDTPFSFDLGAVVWCDDQGLISIQSDRGDGEGSRYDHMTTGQARHLALTLLAAVIEVEDAQATKRGEN